jgi:Protein of unknown function (DUF3489)
LLPNLKGGAAQKVAAKLIAEGLAKEIKAKAGVPTWRRDGDTDQTYSLKLSAAGAKAAASDEERSGEPEPKAPAHGIPPESMVSSESSPHAADANEAPPREGSKLASVMALLRRSEGATILALTETTGWLPHTTRAAITGVRKRGYSVVLDRSAEGASVDRLVDPQESEAATSAPSTPEEKKKPFAASVGRRRKQRRDAHVRETPAAWTGKASGDCGAGRIAPS